MKKVVLDASVTMKWLLPAAEQEEDLDAALNILRCVKASELQVCQPAHWLAETAAVAARLTPETARQDIADLCEMDFDTIDSLEVYLLACELSVKLNHHLFNTLYHAAALYLTDAVLITADRKYYHKAASFKGIALLKNFQ